MVVNPHGHISDGDCCRKQVYPWKNMMKMTDFMSPAMSMKHHRWAEPLSKETLLPFQTSHQQQQGPERVARCYIQREPCDFSQQKCCAEQFSLWTPMTGLITVNCLWRMCLDVWEYYMFKIKMSWNPRNLIHILQLVRKQPSNFLLVLSSPPALSEGGWAKSSTEWQPIFCPRSTKRVKAPTPRLHTYQICVPRIFSINFHCSTANALARSTPSFLSIKTKATPPTSPWGLFVTVKEPFSRFVLRALPGPFSVDIHTICQEQRKHKPNKHGTSGSLRLNRTRLCTRH